MSIVSNCVAGLAATTICWFMTGSQIGSALVGTVTNLAIAIINLVEESSSTLPMIYRWHFKALDKQIDGGLRAYEIVENTSWFTWWGSLGTLTLRANNNKNNPQLYWEVEVYSPHRYAIFPFDQLRSDEKELNSRYSKWRCLSYFKGLSPEHFFEKFSSDRLRLRLSNPIVYKKLNSYLDSHNPSQRKDTYEAIVYKKYSGHQLTKIYSLFRGCFGRREYLGIKELDVLKGTAKYFPLDPYRDISLEQKVLFLRDYEIQNIYISKNSVSKVNLSKVSFQSQFDSYVTVNRDQWALTILVNLNVSIDPRTWGGHSRLVIEGLIGGRYQIYVTHLISLDRNNGLVLLTHSNEKKNIPYRKTSSTIGVEKWKVKFMLREIVDELNKQENGTTAVGYNLLGHSLIVGGSVNRDFKERHNCLSWISEKVKLAEIIYTSSLFEKWIAPVPRYMGDIKENKETSFSIAEPWVVHQPLENSSYSAKSRSVQRQEYKSEASEDEFELFYE